MRYLVSFILSLIIYIHFLISNFVILNTCLNLRSLFDPLYEEIVTNSTDLVNYMVLHLFIELILPLSIFFAVMLTLFIDWSWVPLSSIEQERGPSLKEIKKHFLD